MRRRSRHLSRRIVASAALSVAVAAGLVGLTLSFARPNIRTETLTLIAGADQLEACTESPATWGWRSGSLSFFAYARDGRSANPSAPALEPDLLVTVLGGEVAHHDDGMEVVSLLPTAESAGPCALLRVSSADVLEATRSRVQNVMVVAVVAGMLLAAFGTFAFVVLPLRSRVEALAAAAGGVGSEAFQPEPPTPDALGHIARVLATSHTRIVEAREALEARHRALEEHLTGIAHDLRTPLASMQLALEGLAADDPPSDEAKQAIADVVYLSALVENLHQATRLRHEVAVAEGRVELGELVRRLERRFAIVGRHANVEVAASAPDEPLVAACNPAMAERALSNLIQNAIEHHPGAGHVAVTLERTGDGFELVVADDGPGLPEGALASLEEETFLLEASRRRGPGLGMLITAEIARRAGWTLSYEPTEPGLRARLRGPLLTARVEIGDPRASKL
ncbi:MAG: HAMP domain-containing sensor histidine kinase [Myxococcota bacterium]